jgi:hypothetical protein
MGARSNHGKSCTNGYQISNTVVAQRIRGYRKNLHYPGETAERRRTPGRPGPA